MKARHELINEALRIRAEIIQVFIDAEHWNTSVRTACESRIDPDPSGQLAGSRSSIEETLKGELLCVHVAGPDEIEAVRTLAEADERAVNLNCYFAEQCAGEMKATVQAWPYDKAGHDESLQRQNQE